MIQLLTDEFNIRILRLVHFISCSGGDVDMFYNIFLPTMSPLFLLKSVKRYSLDTMTISTILYICPVDGNALVTKRNFLHRPTSPIHLTFSEAA